MPSSDPLVSVICTTYQHADFVEQCVRSLCSQKTDFRYEVIIRDDASTDGTTNILRALEMEFSDKITLVLETSNQFDVIKPIDACLTFIRGKYVAFCEGDDYWISGDKLQICIDSFRSNPELVLVGHQTEVVGHNATDTILSRSRLGIPKYYPRGCLAQCHTSSLVVLTSVIQNLKCLPAVPHGDVRVKLLAAEYGSSLVLNETLSSYRVHAGGIWSEQTHLEKIILARETRLLLLGYGDRCRKYLEGSAAYYSQSLMMEYVRRREFRRCLRNIIDSLFRLRSPRAILLYITPTFAKRTLKQIIYGLK